MNKLGITAIAAVMTLAFSAGVVAINLSNDDYKARKAGIAAQYKSDRAGCGSFSANARDVCVAEARGREDVARAALEADFKPSEDARHKVRLAKAGADLSVAMEKCDDTAGNVKDVCVKKAKAAAVAARADAEVLLKTANANQVAGDEAAAAQFKADEKSAAARKDAATDKRDADYAVAREKCDTFAGDAKAACVKEAKARFGQS